MQAEAPVCATSSSTSLSSLNERRLRRRVRDVERPHLLLEIIVLRRRRRRRRCPRLIIVVVKGRVAAVGNGTRGAGHEHLWHVRQERLGRRRRCEIAVRQRRRRGRHVRKQRLVRRPLLMSVVSRRRRRRGRGLIRRRRRRRFRLRGGQLRSHRLECTECTPFHRRHLESGVG